MTQKYISKIIAFKQDKELYIKKSEIFSKVITLKIHPQSKFNTLK